jgi:hypothetical protein
MSVDRRIRRSRQHGRGPAVTGTHLQERLATSDMVVRRLPAPCGLDADWGPSRLSAWESHKGVVSPMADAGRGGPERPGLPRSVPRLWPVDGPGPTPILTGFSRPDAPRRLICYNTQVKPRVSHGGHSCRRRGVDVL